MLNIEPVLTNCRLLAPDSRPYLSALRIVEPSPSGPTLHIQPAAKNLVGSDRRQRDRLVRCACAAERLLSTDYPKNRGSK
jgi:hypothetical protein